MPLLDRTLLRVAFRERSVPVLRARVRACPAAGTTRGIVFGVFVPLRLSHLAVIASRKQHWCCVLTGCTRALKLALPAASNEHYNWPCVCVSIYPPAGTTRGIVFGEADARAQTELTTSSLYAVPFDDSAA